MKLSEYAKKRNFKKTPEPVRKIAKKPSKQKNLLFVVQEHHASHLHYDFRLELDGVLKSWAVPKGPSPDPQTKRLAVQVEDHPYDYGHFQGEIPEDEYGGGEVLLWDTGTWIPDGDPHFGLKKGHIDFELKGKRMKGRWTLIRTRSQGNKAQWLLFKRSDQYSKPFKAPSLLEANDRVYRALKSYGSKKERGEKKVKEKAKSGFDFIPPALCLLVDHPPHEKGWIHEIKFDGYRIQAHFKNGEVTLFTRSGLDWTSKYPATEMALRKLKVKSAILDGELVALDEEGRSNFQNLQEVMKQEKTDELIYYVFDLLELNGENLQEIPLLERKMRLKKLIHSIHSPSIQYSEHLESDGEKFLSVSCSHDLEGIVSKKADSLYLSGRGDSWVKAKCTQRQEFVIGGYTEPEKSREYFGALLLGVYERGKFKYVGRCGTGFTHSELKTVFSRMEKLEQAKSSFDLKSPRGRGLHWLRPKLVAEVRFANWTHDEVLRVPSFQGLREDKDPKQIVREKPTPMQRVETAEVTHPDKIIFKKEKITKQQIADYYASPLVTEPMMPLVKGRPLALKRCPEGTTSPCFYQKHLKGDEKNITIESPYQLVDLAQIGAFEIHAWGSHEQDIEHPDQIVMDFDPAPDVPFSEVKKAVRILKKTLDHLGLVSFLKVTGGKGLHVHIPIEPIYTWDEIKSFSKALADEMVQRYPDQFVSTMSKKERKGKIFVDYLRNGRGATAVAPYSLRANPTSAVAMPIEWNELSTLKDPAMFTLPKALAHLKKRKHDPWNGIGKIKQEISILNH